MVDNYSYLKLAKRWLSATLSEPIYLNDCVTQAYHSVVTIRNIVSNLDFVKRFIFILSKPDIYMSPHMSPLFYCYEQSNLASSLPNQTRT